MPTRKQLISLAKYMPACLKTIPKTKFDKLKPHMEKALDDLNQSNQLSQMGAKKGAKDLYLLSIKRIKAILDKARSYGGICIKWNAVLNGSLDKTANNLKNKYSDKMEKADQLVSQKELAYNSTKNLTIRVYKSAMACFKSLGPVDQKSSLVKILHDGVMRVKKGLQLYQKGKRTQANTYFYGARGALQGYIDSAASAYTYSKSCKSKATRW